MTKWTNEQINVFDASGNVLVYASAGSGKTSVMVKKIVDDVVKGVPVKDILVVSYTKASATDMRLKIINALFDVAKDENVKDVDKIREEIDNLPFAEIGTMDSFLSRLIKENFEYLKISPKAQSRSFGFLPCDKEVRYARYLEPVARVREVQRGLRTLLYVLSRQSARA